MEQWNCGMMGSGLRLVEHTARTGRRRAGGWLSASSTRLPSPTPAGGPDAYFYVDAQYPDPFSYWFLKENPDFNGQICLNTIALYIPNHQISNIKRLGFPLKAGPHQDVAQQHQIRNMEYVTWSWHISPNSHYLLQKKTCLYQFYIPPSSAFFIAWVSRSWTPRWWAIRSRYV